MTLSRRSFLRGSAAAAAGLLAAGALETLMARAVAGTSLAAVGYGPLQSDPGGLLDLPAGFEYRALSTAVLGRTDDPRFSQKLTTGEPVPAQHDGMGAFAGPAGLIVLVRNHEMEPGQTPAVDTRRARPYDPLGTGGTTTLWVDSERRLVRSFPSLSGTFRNCAGGVTPWGSWLSAEECVYLPGATDPANHDLRPDVKARHGYVFEVDARAEGLVEPTPIRAMGRFYHEAVAVDPATGFVYLTEDRADGLLYRFRPDVLTRRVKKPGELKVDDLAQGGVLEALRIVTHPAARTQNYDGRSPLQRGARFKVDWVLIPNVDPDMDMERDPSDPEPDPLKRRARTASTSTRAQGASLGAAQFAHTEGITFHRRAVYFCCTNGGARRAGQVWRLDLAAQELSLVVEPDDLALLDGPDNLVPAPNGDLIVCEDGEKENFVVGITPLGRLYPFARNALNHSEFAGAAFAPDGGTLFVNIQEPGITFAIRGPWQRRRA